MVESILSKRSKSQYGLYFSTLGQNLEFLRIASEASPGRRPGRKARLPERSEVRAVGPEGRSPFASEARPGRRPGKSEALPASEASKAESPRRAKPFLRAKRGVPGRRPGRAKPFLRAKRARAEGPVKIIISLLEFWV